MATHVYTPEIKTSEDTETLSTFHPNVKTKHKTQALVCYYAGRIVMLKKKIVFSSLTPSTFCHPFVIVFSSTVCIFHPLFWAQKDHTAHFAQPKENNSAVWKKVNVELESASPITELQSKHRSPAGQCSRVSTSHVSRAWMMKCRIRPTNKTNK